MKPAIRSGAALGGCAGLVLCVFLWIPDATVRVLLAVPVWIAFISAGVMVPT